MKNPLIDKDFLKELDAHRNRVVYVKLLALDLNENPLEKIIGKVTSGSINIDGSSCVRRTLSLSLIAEDFNINEYYWGLKSKFKCELGLYNTIDRENYPEIIWFPQGVFYITSFNTSQSLNQWSISISGKDKMSMLNGDIGGNITAISVDFGKLTDIAQDGSQTKTDLLLKEIIKQAVHEYGKEPYHNIIINDLDEAALELLEYRGSDIIYFIFDNSKDEVSNYTTNSGTKYWFKWNGSVIQKDINWLNQQAEADPGLQIFDHRIELNFEGANEPLKLYSTQAAATNQTDDYFTLIKAQYGDVVGYRSTDLTYAGDLIGNVGEAITTACLDKIKNMLGDYEYFYNLDGQFVWQRKPTYINVSWNNLQQYEGTPIHGESAAYTSATTYSFENHNLVTAFSNTPNLNDIKNDFSIFGQRKLASGVTVPVHIRYAIDKKPSYYKSYSGDVFYTVDHRFTDPNENKPATHITKDYFRKSYMPDFLKQDPFEEYDWWEAYDWAQYWSYLTTGELDGDGVPTGAMSDYWTEYTHLDLNTLYNATSWSQWENHNLFLYDVSYKTIYTNENGVEIAENPILGFTGHNPSPGANYRYSCGHKYAYILQMRSQNTRIYFYKPSIPEDEITEEIQERMDEIESGDNGHEVDWREIIYQMARDYMKHGQDDDFLEVIRANNPISYPTGYTGYEQYYTDMISFWRELYNPDYTGTYNVAYCTKSQLTATPNKFYHFVPQTAGSWRTDENARKTNPYYTQDIYGNWRVNRYVTQEEFNATPEAYFLPVIGGAFDNKVIYYTKDSGEFNSEYWATKIFTDPEKLNFWIDFLDTEGELSQYSIPRIGDRPKAVNDTNIKAVYYRETPTVVFCMGSNEDAAKLKAEKPGYTILRFSKDQEFLFSISTQHKSCKDELNSLLYKHAICAESISITAMPIYYLEPNTRIYVTDDKSGINGEYIVSKISYSLAYNGTMNITATKAANNLF